MVTSAHAWVVAVGLYHATHSSVSEEITKPSKNHFSSWGAFFQLIKNDINMPVFPYSLSNTGKLYTIVIIIVQSFSHVQIFATPRTAAHRLSCPSQTPRACSNSCPLSQLCHPTISSSVIPFSCLQSFPAWVFSKESDLCIRWPKDWNFNFSICPSSEYRLSPTLEIIP